MTFITINGNTIQADPLGGLLRTITNTASSLPSDASGSNFILIQGYDILNIDEKRTLAQKHVSFQEYVSDNTWLCRYEPSDLETLRSLPFVRNADVYPEEVKVTVSLKNAVEMEPDRTEYEVDLVLHDRPNVSAEELRPLVAQAAGVNENEMKVAPYKIRLTVHQDRLPHLAALDSVNRIEEVRPATTYNN